MKIDRGIPIPQTEPYWAPKLRALEIGDSFLIPPERRKQRGWLYQIANNVGIRVSVRTTADGLRVWRVA